jgi:ABC-type transport system involved in multi-copper enzyme maturation permease subunit
MRDVLLVARFELLRSLRTWLALALSVLYTLIMAGVAWGFTRFLRIAENAVADGLMVPHTRRPGALLDRVLEEGQLMSVLIELVGNEELVLLWLERPILVIVFMAFGLVILPFLSAFTSAESISADLRSRGVRYECLRTGRFEFVLGRFCGQIGLMLVAVLLSVCGVWVVGMVAMVGNDPLELALHLLWASSRLIVFALPFVAIGLACSQLSASPNLARTLAMAVVLVTLVLVAVAQVKLELEGVDGWRGIAWDLVRQALPWGWRAERWHQGWSAWTGGVVLVAQSLAFLWTGLLHFRRRDL